MKRVGERLKPTDSGESIGTSNPDLLRRLSAGNRNAGSNPATFPQ